MKRFFKSVNKERPRKPTEDAPKRAFLEPDAIDQWMADAKVASFWKMWHLHPEDSWRREKFRDYNGLVQELIRLNDFDRALEISKEIEKYGPVLTK